MRLNYFLIAFPITWNVYTSLKNIILCVRVSNNMFHLCIYRFVAPLLERGLHFVPIDQWRALARRELLILIGSGKIVSRFGLIGFNVVNPVGIHWIVAKSWKM